jgi:hypothetical protein
MKAAAFFVLISLVAAPIGEWGRGGPGALIALARWPTRTERAPLRRLHRTLAGLFDRRILIHPIHGGSGAEAAAGAGARWRTTGDERPPRHPARPPAFHAPPSQPGPARPPLRHPTGSAARSVPGLRGLRTVTIRPTLTGTDVQVRRQGGAQRGVAPCFGPCCPRNQLEAPEASRPPGPPARARQNPRRAPRSSAHVSSRTSRRGRAHTHPCTARRGAEPPCAFAPLTPPARLPPAPCLLDADAPPPHLPPAHTHTHTHTTGHQ